MDSYKNKKYGLCFAGGGGKGSYEIGVWKALVHLGIYNNITAVSGDSIGAINALLFTAGDLDKAIAEWGASRNSKYLTPGPDGYCSRNGLIDSIGRAVDFDKVKNSPVKCYVNTTIAQRSLVYPSTIDEFLDNMSNYAEKCEGRYYYINNLPKIDIIKLILASTAIPVIYKPIEIDGEYHIDGGVVDNCPIKPLVNEAECENLIIVKLSKGAEYDIYAASRAASIVEIVPADSLGNTLLTGTLDFDGHNAEYRMQLGFYDTIRTFEMLERKEMGIPFSEAEKQTRIRQDIDRAKTGAGAANSIKDADNTMKKFDNLLDKYGEMYGIKLH